MYNDVFYYLDNNSVSSKYLNIMCNDKRGQQVLTAQNNFTNSRINVNTINITHSLKRSHNN